MFASPHRVTAGFVSLAAAGLLLAGCAAPSTGTDAATSGSADTLTLALGDSITNLYPGIEAGGQNYTIAAASAEGLVSVDASGTVVPALATAWEQTSPTTYVFTIDAAAKFQDGTAVTIDDILASIAAARDPEVSPSIVSWGNVDTVEKTGDDQITITLLSPDSSFLYAPSSSSGLFVYPAAYWTSAGDALGTAEALPVGSGPYQVTKFVPDSTITLEKSEYWDGEAGAYDTLSVDIIPEANTRLLALQSGDVQLSLSVPTQQVQDWDADDKVDVTTIEDRSYVGLNFNLAIAPFDDQNVRDAVAYAFDRESVVAQVLGGNGEVATNLISPPQLASVWDADAARTTLAKAPQYAFDLDAARTALAASSVPDGFTFELVYPDSYAELQQSAELLKQSLAEIGVTVNTRSVTTTEWFGTMGDTEHGAGFMLYTPTTADPAEMISWFLGEANPASFTDPAATAALATAREAADAEGQLTALLDASSIQAEANAYAPLWWGQRSFATDGTVSVDAITSYSIFTNEWALQLKPAS